MCILDIVDTLLHEQDKYQQWRKNVLKKSQNTFYYVFRKMW